MKNINDDLMLYSTWFSGVFTEFVSDTIQTDEIERKNDRDMFNEEN